MHIDAGLDCWSRFLGEFGAFLCGAWGVGRGERIDPDEEVLVVVDVRRPFYHGGGGGVGKWGGMRVSDGRKGGIYT